MVDRLQDINAFFQQNKDDPTRIMGSMVQYGVTPTELGSAVGFDQQGLTNYFGEDLLTPGRNYAIGTFDPMVRALAATTDNTGTYIDPRVDPTKFQFGLGDYKTQDIGEGKYNILGADNSVLGVGYKPVQDAYREVALSNLQKGTRNTNVDQWFANNPNATPQQIYEAAKQYGVSGDVIDQARGAYKGASDAWVKSQGLDPLIASEGFLKGGGWQNQYLTKPEEYYTDMLGNELDLGSLINTQVLGENGLREAYFKNNDFGEREEVPVLQNTRYVPQQFGSKDELSGALEQYLASKSNFYDSPHSYWEALGQALSGKPYADIREWGGLPYSGVDEKITGENTLYGSTPVFYNGKLIGYNMDLTAAPGQTGSKEWSGGQGKAEWDPLSYQAKYNGKSHAWASGIGRQIDPAAYKGLVQRTGDTQVFSPLANVSKLPGWTNVEGYQHADKNYGGWGAGLGEFMKTFDPLLYNIGGKDFANTLDSKGLLAAANQQIAKLDPLGEEIAKGVADIFGVKGGSLGLVRTVGEPIGNLVGAVFAGGLPIGSLIMGLDAASQGNSAGVTAALKNAAASYAGSVAGGAVSGAVGGGTTGAIAGGAAGAGVNAAIRGGGLENIGTAMLAGGITGGITSAGAPYISKFLTDDIGLSPQVSQQASRAITKGLSDAMGGLASGATLNESLVRGIVSGGSAFANAQLKGYVNEALKDSGVFNDIPQKLIDTMVSAASQYLASQVTGGNIDTKKLAAGVLSQILTPIAAKQRG